MQALAYFLARFSEPSSYAGLGAVLALVGWNLPDNIVGQLAQMLAAACGLLALCLRERGMIPALLLAAVLTSTLSACGAVPAVVGGLGSAGSAYLAIDKITEAAGPDIAAGCREYGAAKVAADAVAAAGIVPRQAAGKIAAIESFGDAACAHPPAGDSLATAIWLGHLTGQLATLTSAAR